MSYQAIDAVLKHSQSKGSARLLLLCIAHHAHADGTGARPGVETLSREANINPREVRRLTRRLEALNEIQREIGGGQIANRYTLLLPINASGQETRAALGTTGADTRRGRGVAPSEQTVVETSVVSFEKSKTTLAAELEAQGVAASVAFGLANRFPERVSLQLACLSDRKPKDRAATLVSAIRGNWDAPAAYFKRLEAVAQQEATRAEQERQIATKAAQEAVERAETAQQEAEAAELDARYQALSGKDKKTLDATVKERLGFIGRTGKAQGALMAMRRNILRERDS